MIEFSNPHKSKGKTTINALKDGMPFGKIWSFKNEGTWHVQTKRGDSASFNKENGGRFAARNYLETLK